MILTNSLSSVRRRKEKKNRGRELKRGREIEERVEKQEAAPWAGAFDNLSSSFGHVHIYCVVRNNMAPIKRNTGPTVCPRNRINTTPCPVISLINIDRLINVESTRGTRRRCIHRQPIRSPTRIYLNVRRQHFPFSSPYNRSFHSCAFSLVQRF